MVRTFLTAFFSIVFLGAANTADARAHCNPNIQPSQDLAVTYRDRGDRCEGLFQQPVAASARLRIIGAHRSPPLFIIGANAQLKVSAIAPDANDLNLRILSAKPRQPYRLDAKLENVSRFEWHRDVIDHVRVRLQPSDVAALLCEGSCETNTPLIFPVVIADGIVPPSQGITVRLRAVVDLKKLLVTVEGPTGVLPDYNDINVLEPRTLPGGITKDVYVDVPIGRYQFRARAIPEGSNASPEEIRATIILQ
jgi:hypothetical protein